MKLRPSEIEELVEAVVTEIRKKYYLTEKRFTKDGLLNDDTIVESVISYVCEVRRVDCGAIKSKSRSQECCMAREIIFYIIRKNFPFISLYTMAKVLNRDHSTAVYGIKSLTNRISVDKLYKREVEEMCEKFKKFYEIELNRAAS